MNVGPAPQALLEANMISAAKVVARRMWSLIFFFGRLKGAPTTLS